jgi:hypothetical protein
MGKQTGLHAGTWAAKQGQVGRQTGRQSGKCRVAGTGGRKRQVDKQVVGRQSH